MGIVVQKLSSEAEKIMDADYWHEVWKKNEIFFHMEKMNPILLKFAPTLVDKNTQVFVPLCGKSLDLVWLMKHTKHVYAIELSETAIKQFFLEQKIDYKVRDVHDFQIFESQNLSIYCGDLFKLNLKDIEIHFIYYRAALVALPYHMRMDYYNKIKNEIKNSFSWLLSVFDYPENIMQGPPFSVTYDEIHANLNNHYHIKLLSDKLIPTFELPNIKEKVYHLQSLTS